MTRPTLTRALAVAAVGSLVVVLLILLVNSLVEDGSLKTGLVAVLSSILAVLLVSVVWDVAMRHAWEDELLIVVRLEKGLKSAGIEQIGYESEINWADYLADADHYHFVVRDLGQWIDNHLHQVVAAAGAAKAVEADLYLPDPDAVARREVDGVDPEAYDRARRNLDAAWKREIAEGRLNIESRVTMWAMPAVPQFQIHSARGRRIARHLLILKSSHAGPGTPAIYFRFASTAVAGTEVDAWVDMQLTPLRAEERRILL